MRIGVLLCHEIVTEVYAAIEEAVRLRERLKAEVKTIQAVTIGPSKSVDTLRTALALGADSAIHVKIPDADPAPEPLAVAKTLRAIIEKRNAEKPDDPIDLVILGKQSIDDDLGVTGQMLAGLLGWSQATFASKVEIDTVKKEAVVAREIDGGSEEVRCKLPLIVTTDLRCVQVDHSIHSLTDIFFSLRVSDSMVSQKFALCSSQSLNMFFRTSLRVLAQYHEGKEETCRSTLPF